MDMAPPQTPPAIVRPANDAAGDTLKRLLESQQWLVEQQSFLPRPGTDGDDDTRHPFSNDLTAFWQAPVAPSPGAIAVPRSTAFAFHWAAVMRDDATLRGLDGTLDTPSMMLGTRFARAAITGRAPGIHVRKLLFGSATYAGALVLQEDQSRSALLFTPDHGWETFPGLDELHDAFEQRLLVTLAQRQALPGIADDELAGLDDDAQITSRELEENILDTLVADVIDVQRRRFDAAWSTLDTGAGEEARRVDRATDALDLANFLDVPAILQHRRHRLMTSIQEGRLARLPDGISDTWRAAASDYARQIDDTDRDLTNRASGDVESIGGFAHRTLGDALRKIGITTDPTDIGIELFKTTSNTVNGYAGTDLETTGLIELAHRNLSLVDFRGMQARDQQGRPILALDRGAIIGMVRDLDLRNNYQRYLHARLRTSPEGIRLRAGAGRLQAARMRFELAEARAATYLPEEVPSFLDDHAERGHAWVKSVIDAPDPATRSPVEGHDIVVRHISYEGVVLRDILAIGVRSAGSVSSVVLYTPDAPDGRNYREFESRQSAVRDFLGHPAFADYLARRLPVEWSSPTSNGSTRTFRVSPETRTAHWVLSSSDGAPQQTLTQGRFGEVDINGNFLDALYDTAVVHMAIDSEGLARSTMETDFDQAKSLGALALNLAGNILSARVSVAVAAVRSLSSLWLGVENIGRNDRLQAFEDFVSAFGAATDVIGSQPFARSGTRALLMRSGHARSTFASTSLRAPRSGDGFDARYRASAADTRYARPVGNGIHENGSQRFIHDEGRFYGVRFDQDNQTWRLQQAHAASTAYGPAVIRDTKGQWRYRKDIGLKGGHPDLFMKDPVETLSGYKGRIDATAGLSEYQIGVLVQTLEDRGLYPGSMNRLIRAATHGEAITPAMSTHWNAALLAAVNAPPAAPPVRPAISTVSGTTGGSSRPIYELRKLERSQWPAKVWHYTTEANYSQFRGHSIVLQQSIPTRHGPAGLHVMTVDPSHSSREIARIMRGSPRVNSWTDATADQVTAAFVEIDLSRLRDMQRADGTYMFNVYTVTNRSSSGFVIRPTPRMQDPYAPPLSPREVDGLPSIVLREGQFIADRRIR